MKRIVFFLGCLLTGTHLCAQVTISEFLRSAGDDYEVRSFSERLNYLQKKPYRLSPLQRLEFRTQNRELNSGQQEYALRFNPANPWEVRNNNLYFRDYQSVLTSEKNLELKQALIARYFRVVEYLYYTEIHDVTAQHQKLVNDQLSILEKQLGSSFFDADEYVKLRLDVVERSVDLEEIDFAINNLKNETIRMYPASFKKELLWEYEQIIAISRIKIVTDSLAALSIASAFIDYQQQRINLANSEFKLERSNVNPGFLQTEYDRRRVNQERTPFNISLGITIPITNPNKGDMTKRQLEMIDAKYDLEEAKAENKLDLTILAEKLDQLFTRYGNLGQKISEMEKSDLPLTLQKIKGDDPLIVVEFNANIMKLRSLQVKLKREILTTYINYLGFTDRLQQQPLVNYLSPRLEEVGRQ